MGRVIRNEQGAQRILVQPSRGVWAGTRIVHRLEYLTVEGAITTEALDNRRREEIVKYAALVSQVELLTGGELMHGCSRRLERGGWGLKIEVEEQVRFFGSSTPWPICMEYWTRPCVGSPARTGPCVGFPARA